MDSLTGGILAALGAVIVAAFVWLMRQGFKTAVRQEMDAAVKAAVAEAVPAAVATAIEPYAENVAAHMAQEERRAREDQAWKAQTTLKLDAIGEQFQANAIEHTSFDERLRRMEDQ